MNKNSDMRTIDLNGDIGEGTPNDEALLDFITTGNVCCGAHAGDPELTRRTVDLCIQKNRAIVAHPGYPDREWFGRRSWQDIPQFDAETVLASLVEQVQLVPEARAIKPHGGLYNDGTSISEIGDLLVDLLKSFALPLIGLPGTEHERIATRADVPFIAEGFADRAYKGKQLLDRNVTGAVLQSQNEVQDQAVKIASNVQTICIHGDHEKALETAVWVNDALRSSGYRVEPWR